MDLIDKIDELRANSVTSEEFEEVWGITIEAHLQKMMEEINTHLAKAQDHKRKSARKDTVDRALAPAIAKTVATAKTAAAAERGRGRQNPKPTNKVTLDINAVKPLESNGTLDIRTSGHAIAMRKADKTRTKRSTKGRHRGKK